MADTQSGQFETDNEATRKAAREGGQRYNGGRRRSDINE